MHSYHQILDRAMLQLQSSIKFNMQCREIKLFTNRQVLILFRKTLYETTPIRTSRANLKHQAKQLEEFHHSQHKVLTLQKGVQAQDRIFCCRWAGNMRLILIFHHVVQVDPKGRSNQLKIPTKPRILHMHQQDMGLNCQIRLVGTFCQKLEVQIRLMYQKQEGRVNNLTVEEYTRLTTTKLKSKLVVFSVVENSQLKNNTELSSIQPLLVKHNNQLPRINHQIDLRQTMVQLINDFSSLITTNSNKID